jgi:Na+/H+ antiporter NhaD/arsenite permease-like protein
MTLDPNSLTGGMLMITVMLLGFTAMTVRNVSQALALAIVACVCLAMQGHAAESILRQGFAHFSDIAILFTAIAVPAHQIDRSNAFRWLLGMSGKRLGEFTLDHPRLALPLVASLLLVATYVLAALGHNTTSILIMTPIAIQLCAPFRIPTRFVLSGMLVASNLGGFSTRWGDTPNIVEARVWDLSNSAFFFEILPINVLLLLLLCIAVSCLTHRRSKRSGNGIATMQDIEVAREATGLDGLRWNTVIDRRLLLVGLLSLGSFISLQILFPHHQIVLGALTIAGAVLLDRPTHRLAALQSLGYETYMVFASIFVLAGCVEHSWIGHALHDLVAHAEAAPWAIVLTGYLGTSSTEAASWATAAASAVHPLDGSHTAAWALGAGICAGSSSIITAASAGIILAAESRRCGKGDHAITFRSYLPFGIAASLLMLVIYMVILTLYRF